jgi:hypothetical protein
MDLGSSDGDGWLLDALATSPLFSAASTPSWPFGGQHSSSPMDAATAAPDEAPTSARSGELPLGPKHYFSCLFPYFAVLYGGD